MINNKFKYIKKQIYFSFSFLVILLFMVIFFSFSNTFMNYHLVKKQAIDISSVEPKDNNIYFQIGTIKLTQIVPLNCEGNEKYIFYGKVINNTNRLVGLNSQDSEYTLDINGNKYNLRPFEDSCIEYKSKIDYLKPNESTKAYIAIVDKANSASNVELSNRSLFPQNIFVEIVTNEDTDKLIKERLDLLNIVPKQIEENKFPERSYVFSSPVNNIDNTKKQAAIGSLLALLFCPIAIIIGDKVYLRSKTK